MMQSWHHRILTLIAFTRKPIIQKVAVVLFFTAALSLGLLVVDDFGVSVDESFEAHTAEINYAYLTGQSDRLLTYDDRHYGVILTLPMRFLSGFIHDSRADLLMRHTITFLIYFISGIILFSLIRKLKFNRWYAILGVALYYYHPHLFSHSFYNLKDIPFAALFTANLYTLLLLLEKRDLRFALLHGVFSGMLIVIRIPGTLMIATTAILGLWLLIIEPRKWRHTFYLAGVYLSAALGSIILFIPALWHDPLNELGIMFSMNLIEWPFKEIFMGELIAGVSIPRVYLPVYFAVTTPLLYLALAIVGSFSLLYKLIWYRAILNPRQLPLSLPFFGFYFPILVIMLTRPILYNGWRHGFFIYPAFVLLVLYGTKATLIAIKSINAVRFRRFALVLLLLAAGWQLGEQTRFFIISHPYEHVYYNRLAGKNLTEARRLYAMDYWGLGYKEAMEEILRVDGRDQIRVLGFHPILPTYTLPILPAPDRDRLVIVSKDEPYDYFIQHFRNDFTEEFPDRKLIYEIRVDGALINALYKFTGE